MDLRPLVGAALLALFIVVFAVAFSALPARPRVDRVPDDPALLENTRRPNPPAALPPGDEEHVPTRRSRWDTGGSDDEPTRDFI